MSERATWFAKPDAVLTLTLAGPARLMGAAASVSLRDGSLLIGRSPICGWVLPDPERVISGRHCRIDAQVDRFVLTDLSTNGVFVDDGKEPLGPAGTVTLRDGQRLRLSDARVTVALTEAVVPSPMTTAATDVETVVPDDWFTSPEMLEARIALEASVPDLEASLLLAEIDLEPDTIAVSAVARDEIAHLLSMLDAASILDAFEEAIEPLAAPAKEAACGGFTQALASRSTGQASHG